MATTERVPKIGPRWWAPALTGIQTIACWRTARVPTGSVRRKGAVHRLAAAAGPNTVHPAGPGQRYRTGNASFLRPRRP
ncbi:hypothetical protein HLY00_2058 [Mycolicibacterium hippocampi]|uniref:Uncharacterized protein n=1 Tax=Mycolicibacterium hippocampi TaxID=659824 RepID=A0A850PKV3_9MYCO|nr:hypothetical protein [Mycolicibacterium hippocampi]